MKACSRPVSPTRRAAHAAPAAARPHRPARSRHALLYLFRHLASGAPAPFPPRVRAAAGVGFAAPMPTVSSVGPGCYGEREAYDPDGFCMISHPHKLIFFHIPKTAGMSIEKALGNPRHQKIYTYQYQGQALPYAINEQHAFPEEIRRTCEPAHWDAYFKFAIVRNPWDRFVSLYFHLQKMNLLDRETGFSDFVNRFFYQDQCRLRKRHIFMALPCSRWVPNDIDYVGRMETLDADFGSVCRQVGLPEPPLPHMHKTSHAHYSTYYDDSTRDTIARAYADDIRRFSYTFQTNP